MRKIFILSFDDGTVWDKRFVDLLNQYGMKATFNLNSGLEDFVWQYEDKFPIRRQKLHETVEQYRGHEIASHTLTHPWLNTLTPPQLAREVGEDCEALKELFGLTEIGFGVPFTACGEREIRIIRRFVKYIRLSAFPTASPFRRIPITFRSTVCTTIPISGRRSRHSPIAACRKRCS